MVWPLSYTTVARHGFTRVISKVEEVATTGLTDNVLVNTNVYVFVPSRTVVVSTTPNFLLVVSSVNIADIEPPPFRFTPGKASPFTVTVFVDE